MSSTATAHHAFDHPAFFYRSDEEYLAQLTGFVRDGLDKGEPVAAAVPGPRLRLLQDALGPDAERVHLVDMSVVGRNPGRIIASVLSAFADRHSREYRVRIIGEPMWVGRSDTEYPACVQHEALINAAFADRNITIVCPYDAARLDARVLRDARATHPVVWKAGRRRPSRKYAPLGILDHYNQPLPGARADVVFTVTTPVELRALRQVIADQSSRLGLGPAGATDLMLIATELAANSLMYTGGGSDVRIWRDRDHVVCHVADTGQLTDPLAGRRPAGPRQISGRGLLLVHSVADLVRMHTGPEGTTVHAYIRLDENRTDPGRG